MKIITIIWLACYYERNEKKLDRYVTSLFPIAIAGIAAYFMFEQPDLGTKIIYGGIIASIYWISPTKKSLKYKTGFIAIGIILLGAIILFGTGKTLLRDRQLERITEFRNPCDKLLYCHK